MSDTVGRLKARAFLLAARDFNAGGAKLAMEAADEIERLREALRPFAENAGAWFDFTDDERLVEVFDNRRDCAELTVGDLRRARAALEQSK